MVSIVQRERAMKNPHSDQGRGCAEFAQMIAASIAVRSRDRWRRSALILVSAERVRDFAQKSVYLRGAGESVETPMVTGSAACSPPAVR